MGFSLGGFINAAGQGLAGYEQGQIQRARDQMAMQRQIQQDALQRLLTDATIGHLNAESDALAHPKIPQHVVIAPDGTVQLVGDNGVVTPTGAQGPKAKPVDQTPWAAAGFPDAKSYMAYLHGEALAKHIPDASQSTPHGEVKISEDGTPYWLDYTTKKYTPFSGPGAAPAPAPAAVSGQLPPGGFAAVGQPSQGPSQAPAPAPAPKGISFAKPPTSSTAKSKFTAAQLASYRDQFSQASARMKAFEQKYAAHPEIYGPEVAALAAGAGVLPGSEAIHGSGLWGAIGGYTAGKFNQKLNKSNPEVAQYLVDMKRVGDIATLFNSQRYTNFKLALETSLAGMGPSEAPSVVAERAPMRDMIYQELFANGEQPQSGGPTDPGLHKILWGNP